MPGQTRYNAMLIVTIAVVMAGGVVWADDASAKAPDVSVCLAVDCSEHLTAEQFTAIKNAVPKALLSPDAPDAEWALIGFGSCTCREQAAFTEDTDAVAASAANLEQGTKRPLTYTLYKSLAYLARNGEGRVGRLVIVTFGPNTCTSRGTPATDELVQKLSEVMAAADESQQDAEGGAYQLQPQEGETIADAQQQALSAVGATDMKVMVSTIGFKPGPGSDTEDYLRKVAGAGRGAYLIVNETQRLPHSIVAAASGETTLSKTDGPTVLLPRNGQLSGPSTEIVGHTKPNALVKIVTDAHAADTNQLMRSVPGIRHRSKDNGDFHFRFATPRVYFGERDIRVRYAIRVRIIGRDWKGPETIVNTYSKE